MNHYTPPTDQHEILCRQCHTPMEQLDWRCFDMVIVTCTNPRCEMYGQTLDRATYADKDLSDYLDDRDH